MAFTNAQLEQRITILNTMYLQLKEVIEHLQTKLNAKAVGLTIESRLDELENTIDALDTDIASLTTRVKELEDA